MSMIKSFFRKYKPFTSAGFQDIVAYRANFICFLIGEIMKCFIMFFVWKAVFNSSESETFMGFSMGDMVVYIFISFLTGYLTASDGAYAIGEEIVDGSIAMRMIKPCSFDMCFLFQEMGSNIFKICVIFVPIVLGVEIYRFALYGAIQITLSAFLLYLLSLIFAYLTSFYINVCYGFLAFFLKNLWGTGLIKQVIIDFLSGATIPLAFMPPVLRNILNFLPFSSLSYTPVMIYMGMYTGSELLYRMGMQVFWLVVIFLVSKLIWKSAVTRLCVHGG